MLQRANVVAQQPIGVPEVELALVDDRVRPGRPFVLRRLEASFDLQTFRRSLNQQHIAAVVTVD